MKIILRIQVDIIKGKTLLFFDEIQLCPKAIQTLRYFYEECPELHVISAGSLLEFELEKIPFPVGRVQFEYLYPLDFGEYLLNEGSEKLLEERPNLDTRKPIHDFLHKKFYEKLSEYFIVGGMPEAVKSYVEKRSLREVSVIHENLITSFLQDILKYEKSFEIESIRDVLEGVSRLIGKQVKYTGLHPDLSIYKIKKIIKVLEKSLLIHPVLPTIASGIPLGGDHKTSILKLLFIDIGLLQHLCGVSAYKVIGSKELFDSYEGMLCEQFIGQELKANGSSQNNALYFWSRDKKSSQAEVDYLIVREGKIIPLEVKKGPSGRLKSLHLLLKERENIVNGVVLNSGNCGQLDNVIFLPLYSSLV